MPYKNKEDLRTYQKEWCAERRREWLESNGPCGKCGSSKDLEVDHVDRTKKISHKVWSWSEERRMAELAKCQVLCKECHKNKSIETDVWQSAKHGGYTMYHKHRCRCSICREYKKRKNAERARV